MNRTTLLSASLALILLAPACKKKKTTPGPEPEPEIVLNCDLAAERKAGGETYVYEYDDKNRLVKQTRNGMLEFTIEYKDNGLTVVETSSSSIKTYTLNSAGYAQKLVESTNTGAEYITFYLYDNGNEIVEMRRERKYFVGDTLHRDTSYFENTVANGNVIKRIATSSSSSDVNVLTSTHDLSRPNNVPYPNVYRPFEFLNPFRDKNLIKTLSLSGSTNGDITYTYEFDSKGRVTKQRATVVQGSTTTLDSAMFTYRCD